ncbi:MAG: hypothetical protein LHV69_09645 [Elusimicrobia bacterium]|nr:hypothetical protein [Candidatus Obscuribacterium magneticum]
MKKILTITTMVFLGSLSLANPKGKGDEATEILNNLLKVKGDHYYADSTGTKRYDSLGAWNAWEDIYITYSKACGDKKKEISDDDLKIYLLLAFIAKENQHGATSEYFSEDLTPVFLLREKQILGVLKELPYLVPPTCHYLNRYFESGDPKSVRKSDFLKDHQNSILMILGDSLGQKCLDQITGK